MRLNRSVVGVLLVLVIAFVTFTCGGESTQESVRADASRSTQGEGARSDDPPTARRGMLEELRTAHAAPRHPSDAGGKAWLELAEGETNVVRAAELRRWTIVYEAGPLGIQPGGLVRLTPPRFWDWTPAQASYPDYPGYTTATCDAEGVEIETFVAREFWIEWRIKGRALAEGERIRIVYGAGSAMARADRYAETDSRLWVSVDGDGDGFARPLVESPSIDVVAGPPAALHLILPSTAQPGEEVTLRVAVLDALGNYGTDFTGEIELAAVPDGLALPEKITLVEADRGAKRIALSASEPGVYRLLGRAVVGERELVATSNPLLVEDDGAPIRWADLHGHSNLSDGTGTPDDFLTYARDIAGLDVVSLTDHDHWGILFLDEYPEIWPQILETNERYHDPGRFVTIAGYEWTSWIHGHRHVLYFGEPGDVLSSIDPDFETPAQLWDALRGTKALTFAHHSAGGPIATNWDYAPDPVLEPVTEVVSVHGNSESAEAPYRIYDPLPGNTVRDALDRGYELGFIGSGDSHDGHPGLARIASPSGGGLAALLTSDLTRDGVYDALSARRCYATNGDRIILRAAIDARKMGAALEPTVGDTALLYVRAIGTAPIVRVDVVRNGKIVHELEVEGAWDVATTFDLEPLAAGDYVYVRAMQADRGTAWSSPFFVKE